jgi:hypothetical protein
VVVWNQQLYILLNYIRWFLNRVLQNLTHMNNIRFLQDSGQINQ